MHILYYTLSFILILCTFLPLVKHQYWIFRIASFARIQIAILLVPILGLGFYIHTTPWYLVSCIQLLLGVSLLHQLIILAPYINFSSPKKETQQNNAISIISANVYQYNQNYDKLINLVRAQKPNILLTLESNQEWEDALTILDTDYPYQHKIALENTYGMHFYTDLEVEKIETHYFVADDIPSIEVHLKDKNGTLFVFYGVHPPPASPTEEPNSKEKDGELAALAKRIKQETLPVLITGDFNSVAWSRITKIFTKVSGLKDARKGKGFIATFPVKYPLFRVPIDLLFHTAHFKTHTLTTLASIDSDHFPLYIECSLESNPKTTTSSKISLETKEHVDELIQKGKDEISFQR